MGGAIPFAEPDLRSNFGRDPKPRTSLVVEPIIAGVEHSFGRTIFFKVNYALDQLRYSSPLIRAVVWVLAAE